MSINVQKLLDQIETRYNALDSNSTLSEIQRITELHARKDNAILTGAKQYASVGQATSPSGITDSANVGEIYFVADQELDSSGRFFFRSLGGLINMKTATDSAENLSITAAASAAGDTPSGPAFYQGSNYGYTAGGLPGYKTDITKYSYSADGNSTDVGDLTVARSDDRGLSSTTHGYASGGLASGPAAQNVIDKWTFPSDANATDVGNLTLARYQHASSSSETHGYSASGNYGTSPFTNVIDKVSFSSDGNATDVGDAETSVSGTSGNQSTTNGYIVGGSTAPGSGNQINKIQKYPFAADANATDAADLIAAKYDHGTNSSSTHGYAFGGREDPSGDTNRIEKFAMASDANATDVADLDNAGKYMAGTQSTTHGYYGGVNPGTPNYRIAKFPFASDTDGTTDVGDTAVYLYRAAGAQY